MTGAAWWHEKRADFVLKYPAQLRNSCRNARSDVIFGYLKTAFCGIGLKTINRFLS
jgi:hypothetical protein